MTVITPAASVELQVPDTVPATPVEAAGSMAPARTVAPANATEPQAPSPDFLARIPHEFARRHLILSRGTRNGVELLWTTDSTSRAAIFNIGVRLTRPVQVELGPAEEIAAAVDRAYSSVHEQLTDSDAPAVVVHGSRDLEEDLAIAVREAERDLLSTHGKSPAVRLVDLVLFEALLKSASDVHIQPMRDRTLVRYRLDGALHTVRELPGSLASALVSRIKVMARLDIAERRAPQDGRATVTVGGALGALGSSSGGGGGGGRRVDLRISTLPSTYGERVVIRLLDPSRSPHLLKFAALGMPEPVERGYLAQVARASGIVLSTGPTGSGKTTTLYTTLAWLSATNAGSMARGCELNMMTVEDPVEYDLAGAGLSVSQTQVDPKKNVTFATGLRHILRQDPDVIMVGEIRDQDTARIAVQASLTGHLVLSTLHTSDASSAVARLLDLGVEPFLVSSSLSAVLAQRLVRRIHAACDGKGCPDCMSSGFKGRTGIFELLAVDQRIRELIHGRASAADIGAAAQRAGMITLRAGGEELVRTGVTTLAEVARVVDALEEVST